MKGDVLNMKRKVAIYARVSTEHEAQLSALENQIKWYDDQAAYHPNWTVLDKYIDTYHDKYFEKYADEYIKKYEERELGGVLSQDIHIQSIINQAALDFAKKIGINTKGAYVQSRLD